MQGRKSKRRIGQSGSCMNGLLGRRKVGLVGLSAPCVSSLPLRPFFISLLFSFLLYPLLCLISSLPYRLSFFPPPSLLYLHTSLPFFRLFRRPFFMFFLSLFFSYLHSSSRIYLRPFLTSSLLCLFPSSLPVFLAFSLLPFLSAYLVFS